jgi:uncharacterized protein (TIGR03067 family)
VRSVSLVLATETLRLSVEPAIAGMGETTTSTLSGESSSMRVDSSTRMTPALDDCHRCVAVEEEADLRPADADADKKEKGKLEGTWKSSDGRITVAFEGDQFSIILNEQRGEKIVKGKFMVDPSNQPNAIDMRIEEGPDDAVDQTTQGIHKLEGDELRLCLDEPGSGNRPKGFANEEDTFSLKLERETERCLSCPFTAAVDLSLMQAAMRVSCWGEE